MAQHPGTPIQARKLSRLPGGSLPVLCLQPGPWNVAPTLQGRGTRLEGVARGFWVCLLQALPWGGRGPLLSPNPKHTHRCASRGLGPYIPPHPTLGHDLHPTGSPGLPHPPPGTPLLRAVRHLSYGHPHFGLGSHHITALIQPPTLWGMVGTNMAASLPGARAPADIQDTCLNLEHLL